MELVKERWQEVYTEDCFLQILNETYALIEENEEEFKRQHTEAPGGGVSILNWVKTRMEWLDEEWYVEVDSE